MNTSSLYRLLLLVAMCTALPAQAVRYEASYHQAEWRLQSSVFECRLWQPIPYYGDAIFSSRAGLPQAFFLEPLRAKMRAGKARVVSQAPSWDESREAIDLGLVPVKNTARPIQLGEKQSYQLLHQLFEGMSPEFTRADRYPTDNKTAGQPGYKPVKLALSSVSFRKAYREYRACLASLLPVNFDQIKRSRLNFATAKWDLTPATRTKLDHVVMYVKADPSVTSFFIDGHTDNIGKRVDNLELSKKRAETVTRYLVTNGVDESLITTRYHGERYPIASNATAKNRAANRRVTLRLERDDI